MILNRSIAYCDGTMKTKIKPKESQTHRESLMRFFALIILLVAYFGYMSWKFDASTGAWVSVLSWSFFVLCTPIADGGFIVAFPIRLLFGTRMLITQIVVWVVALGMNITALIVSPTSFEHTALTRLLHTILVTPWPDWSILGISLAGTLISIWFGDEMIDMTTHDSCQKRHRHGFKHKTLVVIGFGVLTILAYYQLLSGLHLDIPG